VKGQPVLIHRRSIPAAAGLRTRQPRAFRRSAGQHVWAATDRAQRYQRRAELHSVPDLIASLQEYLDSHNDAPRPYVWTATAESILAKVARGRIALEKVS